MNDCHGENPEPGSPLDCFARSVNKTPGLSVETLPDGLRVWSVAHEQSVLVTKLEVLAGVAWQVVAKGLATMVANRPATEQGAPQVRPSPPIGVPLQEPFTPEPGVKYTGHPPEYWGLWIGADGIVRSLGDPDSSPPCTREGEFAGSYTEYSERTEEARAAAPTDDGVALQSAAHPRSARRIIANSLAVLGPGFGWDTLLATADGAIDSLSAAGYHIVDPSLDEAGLSDDALEEVEIELPDHVAPTPPMKRVVDAILAVTAGGADLLKALDRAERLERRLVEWCRLRAVGHSPECTAEDEQRYVRATDALYAFAREFGGYGPGAIR